MTYTADDFRDRAESLASLRTDVDAGGLVDAIAEALADTANAVPVGICGARLGEETQFGPRLYVCTKAPGHDGPGANPDLAEDEHEDGTRQGAPAARWRNPDPVTGAARRGPTRAELAARVADLEGRLADADPIERVPLRRELDDARAALTAASQVVSPGHRHPYVGEGADGARRSAQVDREEADGLDRTDPRYEQLLDSAAAWDRQAAEIAASTPS